MQTGLELIERWHNTCAKLHWNIISKYTVNNLRANKWKMCYFMKMIVDFPCGPIWYPTNYCLGACQNSSVGKHSFLRAVLNFSATRLSHSWKLKLIYGQTRANLILSWKAKSLQMMAKLWWRKSEELNGICVHLVQKKKEKCRAEHELLSFPCVHSIVTWMRQAHVRWR